MLTQGGHVRPHRLNKTLEISRINSKTLGTLKGPGLSRLVERVAVRGACLVHSLGAGLGALVAMARMCEFGPSCVLPRKV